MQFLAIAVYLGVLALIYVPTLKKLGPSRSLTRSDVLKTLLIGFLPCTVCIMIPELLFDRFILKDAATVWEEIFVSFARAALIEEAVKMIFVKKRLQKKPGLSLAETMLLAGAVGAGYGIAEKLAMGGGAILLVNALIPLHVIFQFIMGEHLFKAGRAAEAGDHAAARREKLLAFLLPFLAHGAWDSLLSVFGVWLDSESETVAGTGLVGFLGTIVLGIIWEIRAIKRLRRLAQEC